MIGTEQKLWQGLYKFKDDFRSLKRFESPITAGASDVEYVAQHYNGWVELKTCNAPRKGREFYLHSPFTQAQAEWLTSHNEWVDGHGMRSYMLLAVLGPRTWKMLLLIEPKPALLLLSGWKGVAHEKFLKRGGVYAFGALNDVVGHLNGW